MLSIYLQTWTYDYKSITSKSSNPELFNISVVVERVSRGVFALSGEWKFNMDIVEGDGNEVSAS